MLLSRYTSSRGHFTGKKLLLSSLILAALNGTAYAGSCVEEELGSGSFLCSGAAEVTSDSGQYLNSDGQLTITTMPGFGIDTSLTDDTAFYLLSGNGLTFTDVNASSIIGGIGISANNYGGDMSIISNGSVIGTISEGIQAYNNGGNLNIQVNDVTAQTRAISGFNEGSGGLSISSTGSVTATTDNQSEGIYAVNSGTYLNIQVNNVSGELNAISAYNYADTESFSVTTTGLVTAAQWYGIFAYSAANGPATVTVEKGSIVEGAYAAINIESPIAPVNINNSGTIRNLSGNSADAAITAREYTYAYGRDATDTATNINNNGLVIGSVSLGNSGSQFVNNTSAIWDSSGSYNNFGTLTTSNSLVNKGTLITANGTATDMPQYTVFENIGSLSNEGVITMGNDRVGDTTVINGNYIGNGGTLVFDSVLGDDSSETDKLVINGDTSGTSYVAVNNLGGSGAATLEGIELIQVNGISDGTFTNAGRIVAGAYDYTVVRGSEGNINNWYLTSQPSPVDPVDPVAPVDPVDPVDPQDLQDPQDPQEPVNPGDPNNPVSPKEPSVQRPEPGVYSANLAAANTMFITRLHDRQGETQYIDALTGERKVTSLWLRNEGGHNRSRDNQGQLRTQANRYVLQLGGDIAQWSHNGQDRFHLGVMGGYGNSKSNTVARSGYDAKGSVTGYSLGAYGTWYANQADKSGLYVDGWLQYNWFNNTVNGQELAGERYKSKGMTASIESGYSVKLGENSNKTISYFIQPQAQLTWMGVKADDHIEANGTRVKGEGDGNIQSRLGVKAFMDVHSSVGQAFQPFVVINWLHNSKDFASNMNGVSVKQDGAANIAELKLGVEGQANKQLNLWGNVGQQLGNNGYSDTSVMLGVKYNF